MNQTIYAFDRFQIDPQKRLLLRDGEPVQLTSKAFDLLIALIESEGREITKDELMGKIWRDQIVEDANLTVTMSHVRKALGEKASDHRFILTIPGKGYRFIADLKEPEGFIIEQHTVSEITIEHETADDNGFSSAPFAETKTLSRTNAIAKQETTPVHKRRENRVTKFTRLKYAAVALAFLVCVALAFGAYKFLNGEKRDAPFQKIKLTRLTNNGKVVAAAISPDGNLIAYVLGESEGNSIWVQQVGTASDIRIMPPAKADVWGLTFTPDDKYIYYNLFFSDRSDPELFKVPSLGGVIERIPDITTAFIAFAPDGKRFAYILPGSASGFNYLRTADADGSNGQEITRKKQQPVTFEPNGRSISWSPDAETIACVVNHTEADASYSSIVGINVKDRSEKPLTTQRWHSIIDIQWVKDGSGLLLTASDTELNGNKVWFISHQNGEARQLTNDLNEYSWLNMTASGGSFVALQTNTVNSIFVGEAKEKSNNFKEIVSEVGPLNPFVWTPDGKIIFRSGKDGELNLWIMNSDGSERKQLTTKAQVDERGICISPDGDKIVFASWRSGKSTLWRVDSDGSNLTQLTNGEDDTHPQCTPDGNSVVYQNGINSRPTLWKVALAGGTPQRLTEFRAKWPAISNDGKRIAYFYITEDKWNIGIISSNGGPMMQRLDVPATQNTSLLRWSPDDQGLFYISAVGNVGNIRLLPLDGKESKPITNFTSHLLSDFSWSDDGKKIAAVRTTYLSDVVLIERDK